MPRPLDRYEDLKRIFSQMGSTADIDDLGFARVDLQRRSRQGTAEVVYGEGKTAAQIAAILV